MTTGITDKLQTDLRHQLKALSVTFLQLSVRLSHAAKDLHDPGVPLSPELLEELAAAQKAFMAARAQSLEVARLAEIPSNPDPETLVSLRDLVGVLQHAQETKKRSKADEAKQQATKTLELVLRLTHKDKPEFVPLAECQSKAGELLTAVTRADWADPSPELTQALQPFVDLAQLVQQLDELDDETCERLQELPAQAFGRLLIVAAARGRLILRPAAVTSQSKTATQPLTAPQPLTEPTPVAASAEVALPVEPAALPAAEVAETVATGELPVEAARPTEALPPAEPASANESTPPTEPDAPSTPATVETNVSAEAEMAASPDASPDAAHNAAPEVASAASPDAAPDAAPAEMPNPSLLELTELGIELYVLLGHEVQKVIPRADHDVDLIIRSSNGKKWIAQCRSRDETVDETEVHNFYSVMQQEKAVQGAIITLGVFTPQARHWAKSNHLYLLDKQEFFEYLKRARARK